jgi:hypothetical protein
MSTAIFNRNFVKHEPLIRDPDQLEKIQRDRYLMANAGSTALINLTARLAYNEWCRDGEQVYAQRTRNFTIGIHSNWGLTASELPGVRATMQANERGHREHPRYVDNNASMIHTCEVSIPDLMKLAFYHQMPIVHCLDHTPAALIADAYRFMNDEGAENNIVMYKERSDYSYYYVNTRPTGEKISALKIRKYRDALEGDEEAEAFFDEMDKIEKYTTGIQEVVWGHADPTHVQEGISCNCHNFWSWRICSHVIAVRAYREEGDLDAMMGPAFPRSAPKGRKRTKSMQRQQ